MNCHILSSLYVFIYVFAIISMIPMVVTGQNDYSVRCLHALIVLIFDNVRYK